MKPQQTAGIILGSVFGAVLLLSVMEAFLPGHGLRGFFSSVCHQLPWRSHMIDGHPFGLCIRCFWLYAGLFLGHARFVFFQGIPEKRMHWLMTAALLAGLDWLSGWILVGGGLVPLRILSGLWLGITISHFSLPAAASILSKSKQPSIHQKPSQHHEPGRT